MTCQRGATKNGEGAESFYVLEAVFEFLTISAPTTSSCLPDVPQAYKKNANHQEVCKNG